MDFGVIRKCSAVYTTVVAHIRTNPVGSEVVGIGVNYSFPGLEGNISSLESGICYVGVAVTVMALSASRGVAMFRG